MGEFVNIHNDNEVSVVNKDYNVVMANKLIESQSRMNPKDAILIRLIVSQISIRDEQLKAYRISLDELSEMFDIAPANAYKETTRMVDRIMKTSVTVKEGKNYIKYNWVSYCQYKNSYLYIKLSEDLKPYLVGLKKHFTQYQYENIAKMKFYPTIGLYELIEDVIGQKLYVEENGFWIIRIETDVIRRKLDLMDKYKVFTNFREKIINRACREIYELGIYWIEATPYKEGKNYAGFIFEVESWYHHQQRLVKEEDEKKAAELREKEKVGKKTEESGEEQLSLYDYTHDNMFAPNDPTPENKKVVIEGPDMDMMSAITVLRQNPGYTVDDLVKLGYSREVSATAYAINLTYSL
jgi:plasmid replication initiation protein